MTYIKPTTIQGWMSLPHWPNQYTICTPGWADSQFWAIVDLEDSAPEFENADPLVCCEMLYGNVLEHRKSVRDEGYCPDCLNYINECDCE